MAAEADAGFAGSLSLDNDADTDCVSAPAGFGWLANLLADLPSEKFYMFCVKDRKIVSAMSYDGDRDQVSIKPRILIHNALNYGATHIVIAHNHPSGDPTPSTQDVAMTRTLCAIGKALDLELLDHIIFGREGHFSFREAGLL